ncbi:MAG: PAS domain-containing protein [Candidatus Binataceae bacterium]
MGSRLHSRLKQIALTDCPTADAIRQCRSSRPLQHEPSDPAIEPTQGELDIIRGHLHVIEKMLAGLFGPAYDGSADSLEARGKAAVLVDAHLEEVVESWSLAVEQTFGRETTLHRPSMTNSLIRFIAHLRDPSDLRTYVHLRRHCQEGMLSRAKPSEFNIFHIALKQVTLNLARARMRGKRMEIVRDTVVAAIDERRLMVAQFYIESREHALRASEEKYRNSINHAPDPMYEIDPPTLMVKSANSAALDLHAVPQVGRAVVDAAGKGVARDGHRGEGARLQYVSQRLLGVHAAL